MKRFTKILSFVVALTVLAAVGAFAQTPNHWDNFNKNLVNAITSNNAGLQQSAMQLFIQHADNLELTNQAVLEIASLYRASKDDKVRQLAIVTLHKSKNVLATEFLRDQAKVETSPKLQNQIYAALSQSQSK